MGSISASKCLSISNTILLPCQRQARAGVLAFNQWSSVLSLSNRAVTRSHARFVIRLVDHLQALSQQCRRARLPNSPPLGQHTSRLGNLCRRRLQTIASGSPNPPTTKAAFPGTGWNQHNGLQAADEPKRYSHANRRLRTQRSASACSLCLQ